MASLVVRFFVRSLVERPAQRAGPARLATRLEASGAALDARFRGAAADPKAPTTLRHILAIERWAQRRLRVALGDVAFERDESGAYGPPEGASYEALLEALAVTRSETVSLARRVADEERAGAVVEHNGVGPLTAVGWLQYLRVHGDLEARRVRRR